MFSLRGDALKEGSDAEAALVPKPKPVKPPGPKDEDPRLLCTMEEVKAKSNFFFVSLRNWEKATVYIYGVILVLEAIFIVLQDYTSVGPRNTFKLKTSLTETASVWVSSSAYPLGIRSPVLNGFSISGSCSFFNGVNYTTSGSYVQPVSFFYSNLDARMLVLSIMVVCFVSHFMMVFREQGYYSPFKAGNGHIGVYVERSISMPLIFLILATQAGITDVWTLFSLLINAWGSTLFSFFAEVLFQGDGGFLDVSFYKVFRDDDRADTNTGGGYRLYNDGVAHYHAISMFAACSQYIIVVLALFSNRRVSSSCLQSTADLPWYIMFSIIALTAIHGLVLILQTLVAVLKIKPSTLRIYLTESENALHTAPEIQYYVNAYTEGKQQRMIIAMWLEFAFIILDCLSKIVLFFGIFIMGSLIS